MTDGFHSTLFTPLSASSADELKRVATAAHTHPAKHQEKSH